MALTPGTRESRGLVSPDDIARTIKRAQPPNQTRAALHDSNEEQREESSVSSIRNSSEIIEKKEVNPNLTLTLARHHHLHLHRRMLRGSPELGLGLCNGFAAANLGRRQRREMIARAEDERYGTDERPFPSTSREPAKTVDFYAQAVKSLSHRSPFDAEDGKVPPVFGPQTLPAGFEAFLWKHSDARRSHKKSNGEPGACPPKASTLWDQMEEYFRPLTLADISVMLPKIPGEFDPCLSIPALGKKHATVIVSSSSAQVKEEEPDERVIEEAKEETLEEESLCETCDDDGDASPSLNWLLGSKHRFLLTSERPNKKHKVLGADAGLDQLLRLPYVEAGAPEVVCDVCCSGPTGMKSNRLLRCDSCKVSVHQRCYGVRRVLARPWLCTWCNHFKVTGNRQASRPCLLCAKEGGALKPVGGDTDWSSEGGDAVKFAHLFCSLWTPEVYVDSTEGMEPVMNIGGVQETRRKLVCYLCKVKHGVCVRCSHGTCRTSFHPLCARKSKHQMEIWGKFGCDNVELRTFCLKHSSEVTNGAKRSESFRMNVSDNSSVVKPPPMVLPMNQLPKLWLRHSTKNEIVVQDEITSSVGMAQKKNIPEQETLVVRSSLGNEAQLIKDMDNCGEVGSANNISNSSDLALIFRKLIDRGKINVDNVASEMGISSNSLEAAILGETSSFSPGLRSKVIKWLQDSALLLKVTSGSAKASGGKVANVDSTKSAEIREPYVPCSVKVAAVGTPEAILVKSLPPQRRTNGNISILKDNIISCPSPVTFIQQNSNEKLIEENTESPVDITEAMQGKVTETKSSLHDDDCCFEAIELSDSILFGTNMANDSNPSLDLPPGLKENPDELKSGELFEAQPQPPFMTKMVSSFESGFSQAGDATITEPIPLEKSFWGVNNCDRNVAVSGGKPDPIIEESCSSYVHPFIKKRLMQAQNSEISQQKYIKTYPDDTYVSPLSEQSPRQFSCTNVNHGLDVAKLDQLAKAKVMGVMELSPEDEVEGEMLFLQAKLLDKSVEIKYRCEDLIVRVCQNLPQELDGLSKRKWDLVLVSQFLHGIREAKKWGRKERRHKEAQAVLAAAAAAAATSSRNSSMRKDANDEIISTHQESPIMVSQTSSRARLSSPLVPRAKDSSRLPVIKVSSDKHSGIFQMPELLQESSLICDICMRADTMLNRVSFCSICKVTVHLGCYRRLKSPFGGWKCELCEEVTLQSRSPRNEPAENRGGYSVDVHCALCGGSTGAFRKSVDGQWVHAFCAEWLLESRYSRGQQNPVEGLAAISKEKDLRVCCICHRHVGVCLKCSYGHCRISFHPFCARNACFYMNVKANGGRLHHKAYCEKHSLEQRETDIQEHGAEELKSMKQTRVELEKLRLLCERLIKREKLKRELVLCSHHLLASQRDHGAFSVHARSPFFPSVISSESVTTSLNNTSYSGTMQRSDDITVDSTITGKHIVRVPHHADIDTKTDDSSISQLSFKRKFSNRELFGGKKRPQAVLWSSAKDGEQRLKARKHGETFRKEVVMTCDQASVQNQRLPKGFVYVPVEHLSKEKLVTRDLKSCEPPELGGWNQ